MEIHFPPTISPTLARVGKTIRPQDNSGDLMPSRLLPLVYLALVLAILHRGLFAQGLGAKVRLNPLASAPARTLRAADGELPLSPRAAQLALRVRERIAALHGASGPGRPGRIGAALIGQLLPEQRQAFLALTARVGGPLEIRMRRLAGTPMEIKGSPLEPAAPHPAPWEDGG